MQLEAVAWQSPLLGKSTVSSWGKRRPLTPLYMLAGDPEGAQLLLNFGVKTVNADSTAAMKLLGGALCAKCAPASTPGGRPVLN